MKFNRTQSTLRTVLWATISFLVYSALGALCQRPDNFWIAGALITSMLVHEGAHCIAYKLVGIDAHITIFIIAAGTIPVNGDESGGVKVDKLSKTADSLLLLAGIPGTLALVIASYLLSQVGMMTEQHFHYMCCINGNVLMFDLIVPAIADGSKVMRRLLSSTQNKWRSRIQRILFGIIGFASFTWLSWKGSTFPSYWGMIFLIDCWYGKPLGRIAREKLWPWLGRGKHRRKLLDMFVRKYGHHSEEEPLEVTENQRVALLLIFLIFMSLGAGMKYLSVLSLPVALR